MIRKILIHEGLESECDGKARHRFQNTFASKEADLESDFPTNFLKYLPVYIQDRERPRGTVSLRWCLAIVLGINCAGFPTLFCASVYPFVKWGHAFCLIWWFLGITESRWGLLFSQQPNRVEKRCRCVVLSFKDSVCRSGRKTEREVLARGENSLP